MKRILITEGDGKSVRRVAKQYVGQVRVYAETDYNNRPSLILNVRPNGEWDLTADGSIVAGGSL
jgi:hypothetical protein